MWLAFQPILTWIFSTFVIKGVVLTALAFLVSYLFDWLWSLLPDWMDSTIISNAIGQLPAGAWWFLDLTNISFGLPLIMSALFVRFLIRRLPIIG